MRRPTGRLKTCLNRDDWICQLCWQPIKGDATVDHIIPKSWRAPDAMWNMRSAHPHCNVQRGNKVDASRDYPALARNLHIMMGGSEEDRLASAAQLFKAYGKNYQLHRDHKNGKPVNMDDIPPIVRMIKAGRFPWG